MRHERPEVLLVEDNDDCREAYAALLAAQGYDVAEAADGREALQRLAAERRRPAVVLLDLMMPVMSGWQLLEELRRRNLHRLFPIVILSAAAEGSLPAGYPVLRKPVDLAALLETVASHCRASGVED